jgi:thioredoxin reductase (NADPH)
MEDIGVKYDCVIVGGGIAGTQASILLGRYEHRVLVIDAGYGRSTLCKSYHNVLGWPDGVPGEELRRLGRVQAEKLGVTFITEEVIEARKSNEGFVLKVKNAAHGPYEGSTLLLATGVLDRFPPLPGLVPCLGLTVYICPDCDGYEVKNKRTIVLGSGDPGASMAAALTYWTNDIVYINHEQKEIGDKLRSKLAEHRIEVIEEAIESVITHKEWQFQGVRLADGRMIHGDRGFIAFGGNEVKSGLAHQLGIERLENKHIISDPRSKMTNVPGVWAAGDVAVHSEQVTIAMGDGSQAAIWIHKALQKMKSIEQERLAEAIPSN